MVLSGLPGPSTLMLDEWIQKIWLARLKTENELLKLDLFDRQIYTKRGGEIKQRKGSSILWFTHQDATMIRAKLI